MRLTEKNDEHYIARQDRVNGKIIGNQMCLDKLGELEDAEEQGLLLRLPCKVGTYVYIVNYLWIDEGNICGLAECDDTDCACYKVYVDSGDCQIISFSEFGKTWFLTREEAESSLAEKGGAECVK